MAARRPRSRCAARAWRPSGRTHDPSEWRWVQRLLRAGDFAGAFAVRSLFAFADFVWAVGFFADFAGRVGFAERAGDFFADLARPAGVFADFAAPVGFAEPAFAFRIAPFSLIDVSTVVFAVRDVVLAPEPMRGPALALALALALTLVGAEATEATSTRAVGAT